MNLITIGLEWQLDIIMVWLGIGIGHGFDYNWFGIGIGYGFDYNFGLELQLHMVWIGIGYGFDYNWFIIAIPISLGMDWFGQKCNI
jgi:hypothetical protein